MIQLFVNILLLYYLFTTHEQFTYFDCIIAFTIFNIFNHFRYEDISDNTGIKVLKSPIQFEPPELDFKEQ